MENCTNPSGPNSSSLRLTSASKQAPARQKDGAISINLSDFSFCRCHVDGHAFVICKILVILWAKILALRVRKYQSIFCVILEASFFADNDLSAAME